MRIPAPLSWAKFLSAALVGCLLLLWTAAAAPAEIVTHQFLPKRFPVPEEKPGVPVSPTPQPLNALTGYLTPYKTFDDPCGLAVDHEEGRIYVSDYHHGEVAVFDSHGDQYIHSIGGIAADSGPCGLAIGPEGSLYINVWHRSVVREGVVIDAGGSTGVAADPGDGRVYVDDGSYVAVYEPTGEPVLVEGQPMKIGVGSLGRGFGVAVSNFGPTDGYVYVPDAATETIKVYDPSLSLADPIQELNGAATPEGAFVHLEEAAIAIEQSSGHVFLAEQLVVHTKNPPAAVYEFDRFGNYRGVLPHSLIGGAPTGIAIDESSNSSKGQIYVTTGDETDGGVYAFAPAPPSSALEVVQAGDGAGTVTSSPAGIDCGTICANEFKTGSQVVLSAQPDAHSAFVGWQVNGAPSATCAGTADCTVELNADTEVSAEFERLPQRVLSVERMGSGAGTVTSAPAGIDCGSTCTEEFGEGRLVTLEAVAEPHSAFAGWTVAGNPSACPGTGSCQVQMNADTDVTATFDAIPQESLSIAGTGDGAGVVTSSPAGINCGSTCVAGFDQGTSISLEAVAGSGSTFVGWSGGGCSGTGTCQVTLSASLEVQARFDHELHQVSVTLSGPGDGEVTSTPAGIDCGRSCAHLFAAGTAVTLSAQPAAGSTFAGWSGACTGKRLCQIDTTQDAVVGAEFRSAKHTLAVVVGGTGNGTVTDPALGIDCGLACSGVYDHSAVATLVAAAAPGSSFAGWRDCPQPSGNRCVASLQSDQTVGADFREIPTLELGPPVIRRTTALLEADVSAAGRLQVRGKAIQHLTRSVSGETPITLRIPLTRKGKRRLAERGRLEVKATVTFRPADGSPPVTAKSSLVFTSRRGR
jgi:DNA-binding beta-propeller fold protein YncE